MHPTAVPPGVHIRCHQQGLLNDTTLADEEQAPAELHNKPAQLSPVPAVPKGH